MTEGEALYLRFGEIPETGRSANWRGERGSVLAGISAFEARRTAGGAIEVDVSSSLVLALAFFSFEAKPDLDALLVEGREVGIGNCGEPLLADVKLVERVPRPRIRVSGDHWRLSRWLGRPERRETCAG